MRKLLAFAVKAIVTGGLIWIVIRTQDIAGIVKQISEISILSVLFALLLIVGQIILSAKRWIVIMLIFGNALSYPKSLRIYFEGLFFNQALPSTVGGDAVRMYRVVKAGLPVTAGINGVLLDRIAGLFALLGIVLVTQPWLYARVSDMSARWVFAIVIIFGVSGIFLLMFCRYFPDRLLQLRFFGGIADLSNGVWALMKDARDAFVVIGLSVVGHLMIVTAIFILSQDLSLSVSWLDCLILVPGVMLISAVPISIGGWGVREGVMITAMGLVGAPASGSLSLSLVFGIIMIVIGLFGGVFWLVNSDRRIENLAPYEN